MSVLVIQYLHAQQVAHSSLKLLFECGCLTRACVSVCLCVTHAGHCVARWSRRSCAPEATTATATTASLVPAATRSCWMEPVSSWTFTPPRTTACWTGTPPQVGWPPRGASPPTPVPCSNLVQGRDVRSSYFQAPVLNISVPRLVPLLLVPRLGLVEDGYGWISSSSSSSLFCFWVVVGWWLKRFCLFVPIPAFRGRRGFLVFVEACCHGFYSASCLL